MAIENYTDAVNLENYKEKKNTIPHSFKGFMDEILFTLLNNKEDRYCTLEIVDLNL